MEKTDETIEEVIEVCPRQDALLDFAYDVFKGGPPIDHPPRPKLDAAAGYIDGHLTRCDPCLREFTEIQRDLLSLGRITALPLAQADEPPAFRIENGTMSAPLRFLFMRPGPAFRSAGHSVIHSTIIPLKHNYVILELSGAESGMKLYLEKGAKNSERIRISLYINDQLSDKRKLHESLSWDIHAFSPGHYRLQLEEKTVLTFDIQE